ncbi:UNVERIFIED_CONTAM: hypothetical protein Sindi_1644900 [Sesamum indicum]
MFIYVEVKVGEGSAEMVEEGEGVAETEMGEGGEEPFTEDILEVEGAEGEGEGVEGDDFFYSDYEGLEGELVVGENDSDEENGESSEEIDVVDNDRELDEKRDSDGDGDGPSYPLFNVDETYNPTFEIGMFSNKKECKKALQSHAIKTKRTLKFTKNDKRRIYAECGDVNCQWKLHAIKVKDEETFQINLLQSHHSCPQIFDVKNMKTNWFKDRYLKKFKSDPKRNVKGETPVSPPPVFMPGPSMFEQLHMNNPGATLQSRVTIHAPPSFRGRQILPLFSTRPRSEASEPIVKEGGQKFLKLNK